MNAYFVMIREQSLDPAALADYGPRAYESPSYEAAVKFRRAGSKSKAFFIEGV